MGFASKATFQSQAQRHAISEKGRTKILDRASIAKAVGLRPGRTVREKVAKGCSIKVYQPLTQNRYWLSVPYLKGHHRQQRHAAGTPLLGWAG